MKMSFCRVVEMKWYLTGFFHIYMYSLENRLQGHIRPKNVCERDRQKEKL